MRAGKALETYICGGPWDDGGESADYQLYHAVLDGEIRLRVKGEIFSDLSKIRSEKWDETNLWALPFDLEVNLDDVERLWNWDAYDLADVIARGKIGAATASSLLDTAILNLRTLVRRLSVRLSVMTIAEARKEIDFDHQWERHMRDCKLLLGIQHLAPDRRDVLTANLEKAIAEYDAVFASAKKRARNPNAGRKPKYDWDAAKSHITEKFRYHGPLSPDDPDWSCQADVEREIQRFFVSEIGQEPATSTVREKAKLFIAGNLADKSA